MFSPLTDLFLLTGECDIPHLTAIIQQPGYTPEQHEFNQILNEITGMAIFTWFLHRVKQDLDKHIHVHEIIGSRNAKPKTAAFTEYEGWYFR